MGVRRGKARHGVAMHTVQQRYLPSGEGKCRHRHRHRHRSFLGATRAGAHRELDAGRVRGGVVDQDVGGLVVGGWQAARVSVACQVGDIHMSR